MRRLVGVILLAALAAASGAEIRHSQETGPFRVAVAGMVHGHVEGVLSQARDRDDLEIVGVYESNKKLYAELAKKYGLPRKLRYDDLETMLDECRPEAVSGMTTIADHLAVVEACAPRGVHVLLEKPLAFSVEDAAKMGALAEEHGILVLTNYETSWYASVREGLRRVHGEPDNPLRRMVFRHGHRGPKEIGCRPEFLEWLTDPEENGCGALVDFGCYGALLATHLMKGERPLEVRATASSLKPELYPEVDDDATIVLRYPGATAVIQASWAWTHDNKDMDLYTEQRSYHAGKWNDFGVRERDQKIRKYNPPALPDSLQNEWTYLKNVVRGKVAVDPLSSFELNETVVWILEEARTQVGEQRSH